MAESVDKDRRRVVLTGVGAVSPFGTGVASLIEGVAARCSAMRHVDELTTVPGLRSSVAGRAGEVRCDWLDRHTRRTMSRMSLMATAATREAVTQAGLTESDFDGRLGLCVGSTTGSTETNEAFFRDFSGGHGIEQARSTVFFKLMSHSVAANVAQAFGIRGRVLCPNAACATAAVCIGLGYEMIAHGIADVVICGGSDEYHAVTTGVFDMLDAASQRNDEPERSPRPFDVARDGVVCSEGAGMLVLESADHARRRGAAPLAQVAGFATRNACTGLAHPDSEATADCIRQALDDAQMSPAEIDYINAHATGTLEGDAHEGRGVDEVFGNRVPVSSLKGHLGHTMAASAALESIVTLEMMRRGLIWPTRNLEQPDPACGDCDFVRQTRRADLRTVLKNSSALGGTNAVLIFRRMQP